MRNILCYGDSNTWGYIPGTGERYAPSVRWTGVVSRVLGDEWCVHEDGMNCRTTVYDDPGRPWLNGKDGLAIAMISQKPLDLLILSLGTNDMKFTDARGAALGIRRLAELAKVIQAAPQSSKPFPNGLKILIISPIHIGLKVSDDPFSLMYGKYEETLKFKDFFLHAAETVGAGFLDAALYAEPSEADGEHMSPEGHCRLGLAIAGKIRDMFEYYFPNQLDYTLI